MDLQVASQDLRDYFKERHIWELLRYLFIQSLVHKPERPREFLVELVEHLIEFRDAHPSGHVQPRLLWDRCHVVAVFRALDPQQYDVISVDQYHTGMKMLHLTEYNKEPPTNEEGLVTIDTFVDEAYRRLVNEFLAMLDCLDERNLCGCRDQVCPCTMTPRSSQEQLVCEEDEHGRTVSLVAPPGAWVGPPKLSVAGLLEDHRGPTAPWAWPPNTSVQKLLHDHIQPRP